MSSTETPSPSRPYVGPSPIEDSRLFFGREREEFELANLLIGRRIVLLHSPSGAGKTSLIQAGLAPEIKRQGFLVMPVIRVSRQLEAGHNRQQVSTNAYLASTLISLEESLPEDLRTPLAELLELPFDEYLQAYRQRLAGQDEHTIPPRTLLVFDQFEEILTLDPADRQGRQEFFGGLMAALYDTRYWILVSMREDYIAGLEPYLSYFPERLNAHFQLEYLGVEMAIQAVRQPAEQFGVDFNEDAARRLVDDLRQVRVQNLEGKIESRPGPYVEPVQLQVVCSNLWEAPREDRACISLQDVEKWGNVDDALGKYYRAKVAEAAESTGVDERRLRRWVERQLITEQGLRSQVLAGQESQYGLNAETVRRLSYAYLLREDSRRGSLWYELAHDRLVDPVREDNAEWFRQKLSLLQRQADLWEREGRPDSLALQDAELEKAEAWAQQHAGQLTETEQDLLERSLTLRQEKQAILELRERELQAARDLAEQEKQRAEEQAASARRIRNILILALILLATVLYLGMRTRSLSSRVDLASEKLEAIQATSTEIVIQSAADRTKATAAQATAEVERRSASETLTVAETQVGVALVAQGVIEATSEALQNLADRLSAESLQRLARALTLLAKSSDDSTLKALFSIEAFNLRDSDENRTLLINNLQTGSELELLTYPLAKSDEDFQVTSVAFGPEPEDEPGRQLLAWGRLDGGVVVWDVGQNKLFAESIRHTQRVISLAFSQDGRYLASGAWDRQIYLWDLEELSANPDYRPIPIRSYNPIVLAFSPDSTKLAAGAGKTVFIYDVEDQRELSFGDHTDYLFSVAWNPVRPNQLAAADAGGNWILWDSTTRTMSNLGSCLPDCPKGVNYLAWSPNGSLLAAGGSDGNILLYAMPDTELVGTLSKTIGHKYEVSGLAFSGDGSYLASSGRDQQLILWKVSDQSQSIQKNLGMPLFGVAFAPVSEEQAKPKFLVTAGGDSEGGKVFLYEEQSTIPLYHPASIDTAFELFGDAILLSGDDPYTFGDVRQSLVDAGISTPVNLTIDPVRQLIAVNDRSGMLRVIDLTTRAITWSFEEDSPADALAFNPGRRILAYSTCVEKDSEDPFASCVRSSLNILDLDTGQTMPLKLSEELSAPISSLVFHPNEDKLFAGQGDGQIVELDASTGEILASWSSPHKNGVTALAYSSESKLLASAGKDGRLTLWYVDTFKQIGAPLSGLGRAIQALRFDHSGKWLYSVDSDRVTLQWDIDPNLWAKRICEQVGRNLTQKEWEDNLPDEPRPTSMACPDFP